MSDLEFPSPFEGDQTQHATRRRAAYEDQAVRYVMTTWGVPQSYIKMIVSEMQAATNQRLLTFSEFHARFPEFPVTLGVSSLYGLSEIDLPELFKKFNKTKIYKRFQELRDELSPDSAMGMLFSWPRLGQYCIVHTAYDSSENLAPVMLLPVGGRRPELYALETAKTFLGTIGWEPDVPEH